MGFLKAADLDEQHASLVARMVAIVEQAKEEDRELSAEESAEVDGIEKELPEIEAKRDRMKAIDARQAALLQGRHDRGELPVSDDGSSQPIENVVVPARAKSRNYLEPRQQSRCKIMNHRVSRCDAC